jgi:hypothetical protein
MQFYPHNVPFNTVFGAVSASRTLTGSFIGNFSAIPVNQIVTASITLNITGSRGTDGTNVTVLGPTGPEGSRGPTGFRGRNAFLLSGGWNVGTTTSTTTSTTLPVGITTTTTTLPVGITTTTTTSTSTTSTSTTTTSTTTTAIPGTTTTTTTTTDPFPIGTCYNVYHGDFGGLERTVQWMSRDGIVRTGVMQPGDSFNICSLAAPSEIPESVSLTITVCGSPDTCTNIYTSLSPTGQCKCTPPE